MDLNSIDPKVSVVLPVYNGEKYLREAVQSILSQTYKDFEFIIINDGSTDRSGDILAGYNDPRILVLSQENKGLAPSLNRGIQKASGEYIARMDADDVSYRERIEKEVGFLDAHPENVIVGTNAIVIDKNGVRLYKTELPINDDEIRDVLTSGNPFYHGSVMFRREAVLSAGLYDEAVVQHIEDLLLWKRLGKFGKMANLSDALYYYRMAPSSIGTASATLGARMGDIARRYLKTGVLTKEEKRLFAAKSIKMSTNHALSVYYLAISSIYWTHIDRNRARLFILKSILYRPWFLRAWRRLVVSLLPKSLVRGLKHMRGEIRT